MRFAFIRDHRDRWPVGRMCRLLGVSRSGYYAWAGGREPGVRQKRRAELVAKIRQVHRESRQTYGSPRMHRMLRRQGEQVSENTVAKLMRREGIRSVVRRRHRVRTTDSRHSHPVAPNVLGRQFAQEEPDRAWAADITYIRTGEGWLYLGVVLDLCSRKIVGWSMGETLKAELCTEALEMAVARRRPEPGLIHHSDRGVQYACGWYREILETEGMTCSMSRRGNCWDNAVAESFFKTLKAEWVERQSYATRAQAKASVFEYIETFYNRKRLHSSLGYVSPEEFEASLASQAGRERKQE